MSIRVTAAAVIVCLALLTSSAVGEPAPVAPAVPEFVKLNSPRVACLGTFDAPDSCVQLDIGYYMNLAAYEKLDGALVRLQDAETRLQAENARLRETVMRWQPGWKLLTTALVAGVVAGLYVGLKL